MSNMKELSIDEQKQHSLQILKMISDFCEKNDINYILSDGTLIGAVRHNGFIPWDDDIDISMMRNDYEKFIKLWNETESYQSKYILYCRENKNSPFPFAKIYDSSTICFEGSMKKPTTGIWVDIFPLDYVPLKENEIIKHFEKLKKMTQVFRIYNIIQHEDFKNIFFQKIKNIFRCIKHKTFFYLYSLDKLHSEYTKEIKRYTNGSHITNYAMIIRCPEQRKYGFSTSCCTDFIYHTFEEYQFRIPKDFDSLLHSFYGDYMKLPPLEKQKYDHNIKAYLIIN